MGYGATFQRARKIYSCSFCPVAIMPGQSYVRAEPHPMERYRGKPTEFVCSACCDSLGLPKRFPGYISLPSSSLSGQRTFDFERRVEIYSITSELLTLLRANPDHIFKLTPEQFEIFVCERLDRMGFVVTRTGATNRGDGGIDIIACSGRGHPTPFIMGVQCKHRRAPNKKTGPNEVREFQGALNNLANAPIDVGMLVTNTTFTPNAEWTAKHGSRLIRTRGYTHLKRWLLDEFLGEEEFLELPVEIELGPNCRVKISHDPGAVDNMRQRLWLPSDPN